MKEIRILIDHYTSHGRNYMYLGPKYLQGDLGHAKLKEHE